MTTIDLQGGTKLKMYESIFEMPTSIYAKYKANELLSAGIENVEEVLTKAIVAIADNDNERALIEAQNTYIAIKHTEANHVPSQVQFGWLIESINEEPIKHVTDEERRDLVLALGDKGLTQQMVFDCIENVKKKLSPN